MNFKKYLIRKILSIPFLGNWVRYYGATNYRLSRALKKVNKIIDNNNIKSITINREKTIITSKNNFKILHHLQSIVANQGDTAVEDIALIDKILKQSKKSKLTVLDIGANIGEYSINLAKKNKNIFFHCFEPMPLYYRLLTQNVALNKVQSQFELYPLAIGDKEGSGVLSKRTENVQAFSNKSKINSQGEKVEIVTIDSFVKSHHFKNIDFIKMDTEGNEYNVLKGAEQTLKKYHPTLFLEFDKQWLKRYNCTLVEVYNFLKKVGYKSFYVVNDRGVNALTDERTLIKLGIENDLLCFSQAKVNVLT